MATNSALPASPPADDAWHEVDRLVDGIAHLAQSDIAPGKFSSEVLQQVVSALGAVGGMIWTRGQSGEPCPQCQIHAADPWLAGAMESQATHAGATELQPSHPDVIAEVLKSGRSRLIVPHRQPTRDDPTSNPTEFLLVIAPWTIDGTPRGAIEIFQQAGASPETQQGCLNFLEAIAELVADYWRNRLVRDFRLRARDAARLAQFTRCAHASLDLEATAYTIANDGRALLGCDRLTILVRRARGQYQVAAVSGIESFRRRANVVRRLEQLATAVARAGGELWYPEKKDDPPPQVEERLSAYLDESHSRWLAVLPLKAVGPSAADVKSETAGSGDTIGILVAERFHGKLGSRRRALLPPLCEHIALALGNALELEAIPLAGLLRKAGRLKSAGRLAQVAIVLALVAAACVALCTVPADFRIEAPGELRPRQMADVFALTDGVVSGLHAEHGQKVCAKQVLAELRRPQLDLAFKQVWGELQTARQRLASTEAEILEIHNDTDEQRRRHSQLIAQQEELQAVVRNLEEQHSILKQEQSELQVLSPMDGEVLTWDVQQLLQDRPVDRGQLLLTVGDRAGPWKLELRIPDREIAHVLAAQRASDEPLEVSYRMVTRPGVTLHGTLEYVALRSETAGSDDAYVLATVNVDREAIPELIPGGNAKAWIHCGRQAVGYVWFHDLFDTIRVWFCW